MTKTDAAAAFRHSRIYAQGWNMARQSPLDLSAEAMARLNPYGSEPERTRWNDGFRAGMGP